MARLKCTTFAVYTASFPGSLFVVEEKDDNKGGREERPWERGCEDGCLCVDSHRTIGALMTSKIYRRHRAFDNQCFM